ncbi:3'(2'),5'-bisphosphate nucleotidase [Gimesia maris]|uniref:3'(2'),5'-bisphosphate nucleotidase n=1 Tax=Gimesia maris TaxID=122 RepID=A0A3D3R2C6_9PLAN|nr:3'(2'),5'-bisphosphate nucleotidase [Gimesia maris]MAC54208.1 3'(2'),5'-bisphosphate nucleotidase [Gimesia sp.]HAW30883.1 3'(2'),5'-bisphosphate nucleotidase [Planctomycetaceae bacterium]EDL58551.1 3'(2'),5'-bisphosphate nucleotidase [Gimesia maris DSM 8797]QDU12671.1 Histidinol-phosphatase [Gimesia maris]QEG14608.1 Histidinol-phosphatase [Gimesia maris]|tara:strand:+ start:319843 stop:320841 length:999 start_codon:yes stop_codon:yes gene_type:complete
MTNPYERELQIALAAVKQASLICRSVQSAITDEVLEKKDKSPVTIADFSSQAVICRELLQAFPADPVIGEEDAGELKESENHEFLEKIVSELKSAGIPETSPEQVCSWIDHGGAKTYSDRFWTLDPIDGTKGFLRKEQYAVSLALIVDGKIVVGVLGCPNLPCPEDESASGTIYYAVAGQGAFAMPLESESIQASSPIHATTTKDFPESRFCESVESGHSSHGHSQQIADQLGIEKEPRRLDSQAKYAVVGQGEADIYMRLPTRAGYREKIWDHAAGVLLVEEAGGTVSDIHGKPLEFDQGYELANNQGVIVTNGLLHPELIQTLKELGISQ